MYIHIFRKVNGNLRYHNVYNILRLSFVVLKYDFKQFKDINILYNLLYAFGKMNPILPEGMDIRFLLYTCEYIKLQIIIIN